tara:strand:- start:2903 stop:3193 length:291 start_codon:yes stop_codon:yes gene_type:complete
MRLVLIEWADSYGCSASWTHIERPMQAPKTMVCRSVGWLAYDGQDCKVLIPHVAEIDDAEQGCGDMTIPTCAVVRVVELEPVSRIRKPARAAGQTA